MTKHRNAILAIVAMIASTQALAWDGVTVATVDYIEVAPDGGFQFMLTGHPALCTSASAGTSFGFVYNGQTTNGGTLTAEGVRAMLNLLTAAKLSGKQVRIYATNPTAAGGCKVGSIDLM